MKLHEIPIRSLPRTSPRTIKLMENLSIYTYDDLLNHVPFRYEDYSTILAIHEAQMQPFATAPSDMEGPALISEGKWSIRGTIERFDTIRTGRGLQMQKVTIQDDTGKIDVTWFNQPYLRSVMRPGTHIAASGYMKEYRGAPTFQCDEYELLDSADVETLHTCRIVPIYEQTRGLSSKTLREKILYVLSTYADFIEHTLPESLVTAQNLMSEIEAYRNVHFPTNRELLQTSRDRLAFNELFVVQLSSQLVKKQWKSEKVAYPIDALSHQSDYEDWVTTLPFTPTHAQARAITDVFSDMSTSHPMNRLIQGDVGSGKTLVAAAAAYVTHLHGCLSLFMAPTEILAQQHFLSLQKLFSALPADRRPSVALVSGSSKLSAAELKEASIVVGTHALISKKIDFERVGLVIVDEQHKFGVVQRAKLKEKGTHPHLLSMTATPIPRTVTLTLYGELDVSVIDELPQGRKRIKTYVVPPQKRADAYAWIAKDIATIGAQVFVVCPLIDESEVESMQAVKAATVEFENLKQHFPTARIGLLHGRQKKAEKDALLQDFAEKKLDILVATPVVEVGIDIPGATVILVETAERFGLAQLHQLRGRVGRSDHQSYCLLFTEHTHPAVLKRLHMFSKTHDGFKLAEYDLHRRGSGNMYGTQQHGMSDLRIATLDDTPLIEKTRKAVDDFIQGSHSLDEFPELSRRLQKYHTEHIARD